MSFHLAATSAAGSGGGECSTPTAPDLVGCISLASLGSGDNLAFRFRVIRDGVRLRAHRPDSLRCEEPRCSRLLTKKRPEHRQLICFSDREAEGGPEPVGRISATPVYGAVAETAPQEALDQKTTEGTPVTSTGFSWVPRLCDRFYSLDMPQRMTVPLAERRTAEERSFLTSGKRAGFQCLAA